MRAADFWPTLQSVALFATAACVCGCTTDGWRAIDDAEIPVGPATAYPTAMHVGDSDIQDRPNREAVVEQEAYAPESATPIVTSQPEQDTDKIEIKNARQRVDAAPLAVLPPQLLPKAVPANAAAADLPTNTARASISDTASDAAPVIDAPDREGNPAFTSTAEGSSVTPLAATPAAAPPSGTSTVAELLPEERLAALAQQRDVLIAMLEDEIKSQKSSKTVDSKLARMEQELRLLYAAAQRIDDAAMNVESLPPGEREAFKQVSFGLAAWLDEEEERRPPLRNARIIRALHDASRELSAESKLDLRKLVLCERVEQFGMYTEFPRNDFRPKQEVILYVEVDNFAAQENGTNNFETELEGSYVIYDATGALVAERKLPLERAVCRNYRRDYFLAYRIYMPDNIASGRYRLELTIEDLKAGREFKGSKLGEGTVEFTIRN